MQVLIVPASPPLLSSGSTFMMAGRTGSIIRATQSEELHHVIPRALRGNDLIKSAEEQGFKFNGPENTIRISKFSRATNTGRHGNHPKYTEKVSQALQQAEGKSGEPIDIVRNIVKEFVSKIIKNPNIKINDLKTTISCPADNTKVNQRGGIDLQIPNQTKRQ